MTEQKNKRTLKELYNTDNADLSRKRIKGPDQAKPVSIKDAKQKVKKTSDVNNTDFVDPEPEVANEELRGYQGIYSLFALCAFQPSQLKKKVDDLLSNSTKGYMRAIFLYFF